MTYRRKHRVVVEVTLNEPGTAKTAADAIRFGLNASRSDNLNYYVTTYTVKQFTRVFTAETLKRK